MHFIAAQSAEAVPSNLRYPFLGAKGEAVSKIGSGFGQNLRRSDSKKLTVNKNSFTRLEKALRMQFQYKSSKAQSESQGSNDEFLIGATKKPRS